MNQPTQTVARLQEIARVLDRTFLGKSEAIRLMLVAALAGEHMVLVGPPGTAKSAIVRMFARLVSARYFEYLLTRFTEPNEIFGPIDIQAFREGRYQRRMDSMLPEAEIVFLDEVFKSNSAILNSLLGVLNERMLRGGRAGASRAADQRLRGLERGPKRREPDGGLRPVPACASAATTWTAITSTTCSNAASMLEVAQDHRARLQRTEPILSSPDLHALHGGIRRTHAFPRGVPGQVQGARLPDPQRGRVPERSARGQAAQAVRGERPVRRPPDGRSSDFFVLRHIWNNLDQAEILEAIIGPVVEA